MKITLNHFLFTVCCCLILNQTQAQNETEKKQTFPISISITNHSWAFPFNKVFRLNPLYPGISAGTEFYYKNKPTFKFFQTAQIGGFLNKASGAGCYFNSNIGLRHTMKFGLAIDFSFGLGYFHSFYPSDTYVQNLNGEFEKSNKGGVGAMSGNISLGLGYDFSRKKNKYFTPFIQYQWIAGTYYWSLITIRPNGLLHLGIRFNPFQ
jgi:hypothetical protein